MKKSLFSLFFSIIVLSSFANETEPPFYAAEFPASKSGSIMMDYTSVHVPSQDKTYYECLVWNIHTGKSILYHFSYSESRFEAYSEGVQLPTNPLGNSVEGDYMMDYTSIHVPSQDKTYYEVIIWDTKTGLSKLYFFDYNESKFLPYEETVQLPSEPMN